MKGVEVHGYLSAKFFLSLIDSWVAMANERDVRNLVGSLCKWRPAGLIEVHKRFISRTQSILMIPKMISILVVVSGDAFGYVDTTSNEARAFM
jgi:hypothetical protein